MHIGLISKPHLVDLLRIFDKRKWIVPRIRYASVRSKPELIADIKQHFLVRKCGDVLRFFPKNLRLHVPTIEYDLSQRRYLLDGRVRDIPKESRQKPLFSISHVPVTLDFAEFFVDPPGSRTPPSTRRASVSSEGSPGLGTRNRPGETARSEPSSPAGYTPTLTPSCHFAWEGRTPEGSLTSVEPV